MDLSFVVISFINGYFFLLFSYPSLWFFSFLSPYIFCFIVLGWTCGKSLSFQLIFPCPRDPVMAEELEWGHGQISHLKIALMHIHPLPQTWAYTMIYYLKYVFYPFIYLHNSFPGDELSYCVWKCASCSPLRAELELVKGQSANKEWPGTVYYFKNKWCFISYFMPEPSFCQGLGQCLDN